MSRVLILATTTGYQIRAFGEAAERLGVDLVYATDRCHVLDDPWHDEAVPIRFYDEEASAAAILDASRRLTIDGVVAVGDRPTVIAARVLQALGLPGHTPDGASTSRNKLLTRERLREEGLPTPWFQPMPASADVQAVADAVRFPCVIKPLALSGSRGVMRANDRAELMAAFYRLHALLQSPDILAERSGVHDMVLIEEFIEGRELALEAIVEHGALRPLALFDKPDPLDGPFFEETIYATPSIEADEVKDAIVAAVARAAAAFGLCHGPIHAECRVNDRGVHLLEVAARPIGGLCSRALRFVRAESRRSSDAVTISLEELLLRHALRESLDGWEREPDASGVMMIPTPRRGILRQVSGLDRARGVALIEDVRITAKTDQTLVPLPEGASYLGFIFSRGERPADVVRALRTAHAQLSFAIDSEVRVLQSQHG